MTRLLHSPRLRSDTFWAALLGLGALLLYGITAAPSVAVLFDDTLEFQVVVPTLGIAHPSGYPLYTLLGKLFTLVVPWRDPAGRLNLFSAVAAAGAVAVFYLAVRRWARQPAAALVVTLAWAVSPVWWSQATLAEVYALHGLFVAAFLYEMLRWEEATMARRRQADRWLAAAALTMGLGLTHHRMLALLLPAALVLIVWTNPRLLRRPAAWVRPVVLGVAPLLLYLYLPLRGRTVGSLDGAFSPTLNGTVTWVLARAYTVFLTGNPFNVHRDANFFYGLFGDQFGPLLLMLAGLGLIAAWRFGLRRYVFLLLATIAQVAFGVAYKVEDVGVFLLPAFMLVGMWAASGIVVLWDTTAPYLAGSAGRWRLPPAVRPWLLRGWMLALSVVLLADPLAGAVRSYPQQDRSRAWQVYDYGRDMLAHVAPGGEVIGLGGEITLLRYFRDVLGQRPDLQVVRADGEAERRQALQQAVAHGLPVYLTRDLPGAAARYSLSAAGPLIEVRPRATASAPPGGQPVGAGILLAGATTEWLPVHTGRMLRLNVTWVATNPVKDELKVSARLLDAGGRPAAPQNDRVPVHFAYPTTAWVPGERITDVYDLTVSAATPGPYRPLLILYRAANGQEIGRVELPPVTYP